MVQIKLCKAVSKKRPNILYIPYGSNKTPTCNAFQKSLYILYIPYGSNKTKGCGSIAFCGVSLYIPYGSNKTSNRYGYSDWFDTFISHMVQIKHVKFTDKCLNLLLYIPYGSNKTGGGRWLRRWESYFISHMVQIKHSADENVVEDNVALYPIWFK